MERVASIFLNQKTRTVPRNDEVALAAATKEANTEAAAVLGFTAAESAYAEGDEWLQALLDYLRGNRERLMSQLADLPGIKIAKIEATYLAWIDISAPKMDNPIAEFEAGGVGLSPGAQFGDRHFVRLNFGCSRQLLDEALSRMRRVILAHAVE